MQDREHQRVVEIIRQKDQAPLALEKGSTALLVIDMQRCFVSPNENFSKALERLSPEATRGYFERIERQIVPNVARLIAAFRRADCPVIFTGTGTEDGTGRDLAGWLQGIDELGRAVLGEPVWPNVAAPAWQIDAAVAPQPSETVLRKRTADAFLSTELEGLLKRLNVSTVVVAGLTSDVCVSATARSAADRGYLALVAEDACTTLSEAMHRASLEAIALTFGRVKTTDEIIGLLAASEAATQPALPPIPA